MTDGKITPIRHGVQQGDVFKQQVTDSLGDLYDQMAHVTGQRPVAVLMVVVNQTGGAMTGWHVEDKNEHQTSLYVARALQIAQIDLHQYQLQLNQGCPHG